jgi:hypothetical protein
MSKGKTQDGYEVGYGKPPKKRQFQKGVSGNPKGRPKKCRNFDEGLIRESKSFMTISENGRRKRISKHEVIIKQLIKLAMTGSTQALRIYLTLYHQAHERATLFAGFQPDNSEHYNNVRNWTTEELELFIADSLSKETKPKKHG